MREEHWQRLVNTCSALLYAVIHAYVALMFYGQSMVNESIKTGTERVLMLQWGLGGACAMSLLIIAAALLGWSRRLILWLILGIAFVWLLVARVI